MCSSDLALQAAANAKIAEMETAHAAALSNLKKIKQLEINKLTAEQLSLRIEQQTLKNKAIQAQALANQAARNLETARASGNAAAAKAAQLTANIAAKNAKAAEQNAALLTAQRALTKAKANAAAASDANRSRAFKELANARAEFNRKLAANKANANAALKIAQNALASATSNKIGRAHV